MEPWYKETTPRKEGLVMGNVVEREHFTKFVQASQSL